AAGKDSDARDKLNLTPVPSHVSGQLSPVEIRVDGTAISIPRTKASKLFLNGNLVSSGGSFHVRSDADVLRFTVGGPDGTMRELVQVLLPKIEKIEIAGEGVQLTVSGASTVKVDDKNLPIVGNSATWPYPSDPTWRARTYPIRLSAAVNAPGRVYRV